MTDDPLRLFADWYAAAEERESSPHLAALATAAADGAPSVRMVELQRFDDAGFVFYTGAQSRKGRELAENPRAALCFYWHESHHQARVEGRVEPHELDPEETRALQVAAAIGMRQGEVVRDRGELERRVESLRGEHGLDRPLPLDWAAFRLVPEAFEFWEARDDALHERLRYSLGGGRWSCRRLFP